MSLYLVVMVTFNLISLQPLLAFVHQPLRLKFWMSLGCLWDVVWMSVGCLLDVFWASLDLF